MKTHDVFSFGVVSSSTLYSIQGDFPAPEGYAEIDKVRYMTGGEAANSSIVLSHRVADIGFQAGIPVVTVDCRHDDPLLQKTSAAVIAESFIRENYVDHDLPDLFRKYQGHTEGIVIFTFGDRAIWHARPGESVKKVQPFSIEPVDTSGGGDSFRAGIVYGLLMDWDDKQTIEFAAAIAALVCTRFPGVLNAPSVDEVLDFMRSRQRSVSN